MVDSGGKKTFIDKLLLVLKPRRSRGDIVEYAESIIDDYTGLKNRRHRQSRGIRRAALAVVCLISLTIILLTLRCALKIFF